MQSYVAVRYSNNGQLSPKSYCFLSDIPDLKTGDYCIVMSPKEEPVVVQVTDHNVIRSDIQALATKWLVCKIDLLPYLEKERTRIMNRRHTDVQ